MIISQLDVSLEGFEIGLSGAIPIEASGRNQQRIGQSLSLFHSSGGLVFKYGGRIVHGSHPTFTPVIFTAG